MKAQSNNKSTIVSLVEYIENNWSRDINTEILSRIGFVSHTQLYRDFYSMTGHSVKEYVRRRRLSNTLALIKASELPLAEIAYACGYSSQQVMCRVVKNAVNKTPLEYKKSNEHYYFPPYNGSIQNQITVSSENIPQTLCLRFYQFSLRDIENNAVAYFLSLVPDFKGRIFGRNSKQRDAEFCYELYISDYKGIENLLRKSRFEISQRNAGYTSLYATTTVRNIEDKINASWDYLYKTWLAASMFEYSGTRYFEEYIVKDRQCAKLRLFLPIEKRRDYTMIALEKIPQMQFLVSQATGISSEQTASQTVIGYLSKNYTHIMKSSKEFYIQENRNYTCGIKVKDDIPEPKEGGILLIRPPMGLYAVLYSSVAGDYPQYRDMLFTWLQNNGIAGDENNTFMICDAKDSFENPEIKVYCLVNGSVFGTK